MTQTSQRFHVRDLARAVGTGRQQAVEVARDALARVRTYDAIQPSVWIFRLPEQDVLAQAQEVERRVASGENLPLAGVPFAIKDNIDVAALATTAACPAFAYVPPESAPIVARLIEAGAVLIGKTNMDQFATGLTGTRSPFGACGSVTNRDYISGGSSSGSAVAVAAGLVGFALGTDTAGSGRVPAALNHIVGLKPTRGRWSTRGLVPACRTLDCVSVFCTTIADAALLDEVLTEFDEADPYSRRVPLAATAQAPAHVRVGVPRGGQLEWFSDKESDQLFREAVARVAAAIGDIVEIDYAPLGGASALLYQGPWVAERLAATEDLLTRQPSAIHPVVRGIIEGARRYSAIDAFKAAYKLSEFQRQAERLWETIDVLLLPTAPTTYRIREVLAEPLTLNSNLGFYTNFVNLLDMSAIALPAGYRQNATGFGISLIGPPWADRRLLALAQRYEDIAPMPGSPPLDLDRTPKRVRLAVVGAHLSAMPLHWQLSSRQAVLVRRCRTAPTYKLYAMAKSTPPKPALTHVSDGGAAIEVEIYELSAEDFGSFVAEVPAPLAIGTVTLEDGSEVKGFVAEPRALVGAEDITALGGWRAYIGRETAKA